MSRRDVGMEERIEGNIVGNSPAREVAGGGYFLDEISADVYQAMGARANQATEPPENFLPVH